MTRAIELGATSRLVASPNPWVGAVIVSGSEAFEGATERPGGRHAERVALDAAGARARGSTMFVTLEPCSHHGRTPPCVDAIVEAGVARVVVGLTDPDPEVDGAGIAALTAAGIEVTVGVRAAEVAEQLAPYLTHRRTGRPFVVCKLAASLDGRTAAPDGSSRWITGPEARADAHLLRAESDAVLVGVGTVRADDPALTVRDAPLPSGISVADVQPLRVVLGTAPPAARVQPALELDGGPGDVLDELGRRDVLQVLIEGGPTVAGEFHRAGLVDRYVLYLAPVLFGGDDGAGVFTGDGAAGMGEVWRGTIADVKRLGGDVRVELVPGAGPELA